LVVDQQFDQIGLSAYLGIMSRQVNLYEAKTRLSRLVEEAANGDTIIIAKDGKPMAKLGPISDAGGRQPRKLGQLAKHAKGIDWVQWWRDWKAADKEIEAAFEAAAVRPIAPRRPRRRR
jgi:prevent-host-death family protein